MRALSKALKPNVLVTHGQQWTHDYVADPESPGHWGHPEIRTSLGAETHGKCAYCEGFVPDVSYEHVEHILPKSKFPELAHEWTNLTSACARCNINKDTYHVAGSEVLNPYIDDPAQHLNFFGNLISHVAGSSRGEITWRKLKLDRLDLAQSRTVRLMAVRETLLRWRDASEPLKSTLEVSIVDDAAMGEFTAAVRAYLQSEGFPIG